MAANRTVKTTFLVSLGQRIFT